MKFLKSITRSLFGLSPSSKAKKKSKKAKAKRPAKPVKKKKTKKITKKKLVKKPIKKKAAKAKSKKGKKSSKKGKKRQPQMVKEALALIPLGEVTHYFPHVKAAVVQVKQGEIRPGAVLSFRGHTTKFKQAVDSIQIDHKPIPLARKGDEIGIRVKSRVRAGDKVYKV